MTRLGTDADNEKAQVSTIAVRNGTAASRKGQRPKELRIIVVEDHPVLRDGLMQLNSWPGGPRLRGCG